MMVDVCLDGGWMISVEVDGVGGGLCLWEG